MSNFKQTVQQFRSVSEPQASSESLCPVAPVYKDIIRFRYLFCSCRRLLPGMLLTFVFVALSLGCVPHASYEEWTFIIASRMDGHAAFHTHTRGATGEPKKELENNQQGSPAERSSAPSWIAGFAFEVVAPKSKEAKFRGETPEHDSRARPGAPISAGLRGRNLF